MLERIAKKIFGFSDLSNAGVNLLDLVNKENLWPQKKLARLGTAYGGWWIPLDCSPTICYSAGAGEDISFDVELAKRFRSSIRIIDPTPRAIEHFQKLQNAVASNQPFAINNSATDFYTLSATDLACLHFVPYGLASEDTDMRFYKPRDPAHVSCSVLNLQKTEDFFMALCYRLESLMHRFGDTHIDLLKLDIEGAEYSVLDDLIHSKLLPPVLLVEFDEAHTPLDSNAHTRIDQRIRALEKSGMHCIFVESSNATFIRI
jgi:FkbM family methyltransferase